MPAQFLCTVLCSHPETSIIHEWVSQVKTKTHPWWPPGNLSREVFESQQTGDRMLSVNPRGCFIYLKIQTHLMSVPKGPHSWSARNQCVPQIWEQLWPMARTEVRHREGIKRRDLEHARLPRMLLFPCPPNWREREQWKRSQSSMPWQDPHIPSFISSTLSFIRTRSLGDLGKDSHNTRSDVNHQRAQGGRAPFLLTV